MEPGKASTRMKTKKTKMLISFKNTFCSKNRQTQKFVLNLKIWKLKFEIWIWNVTNQVIVFSTFIQSGFRGTTITLAFNWVPFQCSKINKYEDHFFSVPFMPLNKSFIDQASSVKMAGYWPRSLFMFLWTSTSTWSIKTQKENSANIQPSWPRAWPVIYAY